MKKKLLITFLLIINIGTSQVHQEFHDNGKLYISGELENDKKNGIWKRYHKNGELYSIGHYKNDKKKGKWKYYNNNGILNRRGKYKKGNKKGKWREYREDGELYSIGEYAGEYDTDKKTKKWTYYYRNGQIEKTGAYSSGQEIREWFYYHQNGQLDCSGVWAEGSIWTYYHSNGKFKGKSQYLNNYFVSKGKWYHSNGEISRIIDEQGGYKEFDEKGQIIESRTSSGAFKTYYPNGNLKESGVYLKTKQGIDKNGEWKYYSENGKLQKSGNYIDDSKNGEWTYYHKNGKIQKKGIYSNDSREGKWMIYNENGEILINNNKPEIISNSTKIEDFVPNQWKILQQVQGDLNNDTIEDVVLIIENTAPENLLENDHLGPDILNINERYLLVLLQNKDQTYTLNTLNTTFIPSQNDDEALCLVDPLQDTQIIDNRIKFTFNYWSSCGSYSTNEEEYIFAYYDTTFELIQSNSFSFMRNSGEETHHTMDYLTMTETYSRGGNMFIEDEDKPTTSVHKIEVNKRIQLKDFKLEE